MSPALRRQLQTLPPKPGVYTFFDVKSEVLYVGKATSLKSRVPSYFRKGNGLSPAKRIMVSRIVRLETIVTINELEALMLETTRIKSLHPPFNIVMRDDKNFLYIKVALKEPYPSVTTVRRLTKDGSRYFGPYVSASTVYSTLKLLKKIFPYKNCGNPAEKPCFEFHLHRCLGHGTDETSREAYRKIIHDLMHFLRGDTKDVRKELEKQMKAASAYRQFEKAAVARDRVFAINKLMQQQNAIMPADVNVDCIGYATVGSLAAVNRLLIRNGKILDRQTFLLQHVQDEKPNDVVASFMEQFYSQVTDPPEKIALPFALTLSPAFHTAVDAETFIPQRGRLKKLMKVSELNAAEFLRQQKASFEKDDVRLLKGLRELAVALNLTEPPKRIEAFDVANVQGEHATGSMVTFVNGRPEKKWYRRFTIKTVQGANDPAMMREVLVRRYGHAPSVIASLAAAGRSNPDDTVGLPRRPANSGTPRNDSWPLPDLIILDGGAGQLGVVTRALGKIEIPIIALAKAGHAHEPQQGDRERIFRLNKPPKKLPNPSDGLFLIERIRDEAHRFTIAGYRGKHRKASIGSALDAIPGVGPTIKKKLLKAFGSVAKIRQATEADIAKVVGPKLAEKIISHL
ncbi:MAG: excinuclease ABC subunit UvrC [bacterium]|nr:excinuclease ABC subunit UvrC [bacterium]